MKPAQASRATASAGVNQPRERAAEMGEVRLVAEHPAETPKGAQMDPWGAVVDGLEDGLIAVDADGRITRANPSATKAFGDDILEMAAAAWAERFGFCRTETDAVLPPDQTPLYRALRGDEVLDEELLARNSAAPEKPPRWMSVTSRPVLAEDGSVQGAWMLLHDIGMRKKFQGEVLLRDHALNISVEGFTISDATKPDNPLIYVNEGFERLTGYSKEEVLGHNCRFLQGKDTNIEARAEIRRAIEEERNCVVELLNYRKDGTPFWNRLSLTPVTDEAGRLRHFIGVQTDITEHVTTEQRLQEASEELWSANARLMENVNAAARVQRSMLPQKHIQVPGADFAWRYQPCEGLAGDLLNIFRLDEEHVGFYVLDVSGHGTAAALLAVAVNRLLLPTVSASSLVKRQRRKDGAYEIVRPGKVADELNKTFPWDPETGQFFTIVYAVLNTRTRQLRYVSAGHPGFVHVPVTGGCEISTSADLPIGLQEGHYEEHVVQLAPGDRVYMYSDGVTECANAVNGLFGEERLCSALEEQRRLSLDGSLEDLVRQLDAWRRGAAPRDDISLLACEIPR